MMLAYPDRRLYYDPGDPDQKYNLLSDWIEGSVAFIAERLSETEVVDVITRNELAMEQDDARFHVELAWSELFRRQILMHDLAPFRVENERVYRTVNWADAASHSFCMAASFSELYSGWDNLVPQNYQTRGALFERLCAESLQSWGWKVVQTGWGPGHATQLPEMAKIVAQEINEPIGDTREWVDSAAKDEGLDLVSWMPFPDLLTAKPLYLGQCTTGRDWKSKARDPDLKVWQRILGMPGDAQRVFAIPFALTEAYLRKTALRSKGMILDRYRVVSPRPATEEFISEELRGEIVEYLEAQIPQFPTV